MAIITLDDHPSTVSPSPIIPPPDIQKNIGDRLEFTTLTDLAYAWPSGIPLLKNRKWGFINLTLPSHLHDRELDVREAAMAAKVDALSDQANKEDWGRVQSIRVGMGSGATAELKYVLRRVSASLTSLEMVGSVHKPSADKLRAPHSRDTIDYQLLSRPLTFPLLADIRIGPGAISDITFCLFLCTLAPNVQSINMSLERYELEDDDILDEPLMSSTTDTTHIRKMRLSWDGVEKRDNTPSIWCVDLLRASPEVKQLIVRGNGEVENNCDLPADLSQHQQLRDFYWNMTASDLYYLDWRVRLGARVYHSPRRAVFKLEKWIDTFDRLPRMVNLEQLFLDFHQSPGSLPLANISSMPNSQAAISMLPNFSLSLRSTPKLVTIHTLYHDNSRNANLLSSLSAST